MLFLTCCSRASKLQPLSVPYARNGNVHVLKFHPTVVRWNLRTWAISILAYSQLGVFRVIFALWGTPVSQNAKIRWKTPSSVYHVACNSAVWDTLTYEIICVAPQPEVIYKKDLLPYRRAKLTLLMLVLYWRWHCQATRIVYNPHTLAISPKFITRVIRGDGTP